MAELREVPSKANVGPATGAGEGEPVGRSLGDLEQLRAALDECGSVAELSRQSGQPVERVRAVLEANGLVAPKRRRGSLSDEELRRAGREREAGTSLRALSKSYGVSRTYLCGHLPRVGGLQP